jgi:DinB family protein
MRKPCPDCGFDPTQVAPADVPARARRYCGIVADAVEQSGADRRPSPAVWSPVEYGCHVRDVCRLFDQRLHLMLDEDDPTFANWDQDETALEQRYWTQRPADVAAAIRADADRIADSFAAVTGTQWQRSGRRSNGSLFTVDTLARYFLHDIAHHAWDVTGRQW